MGQANRTVIVFAFDDDNEPDKIGFNMSGFGVKNHEIKCSKDSGKRKMRQADHHTVVFELANRSKADLRFPNDAGQAIWVAPDDNHCPKTPAANPEIKPQKVSQDGEQLTVHNLNTTAARYKFSLVLEDATSGKKYLYDPIWDNRNGGSTG